MKSRKKLLKGPNASFYTPTLIISFSLIILLGLTSFTPTEVNAPVTYNPGVVFEIEVKDHEQSPPKTSEMEVSAEGKNIKIPVASRDGERGKEEVIYNGDDEDNRRMIVVDHNNKSYMVVDESFADGMKSQLSDAEKMMKKAMDGLTDEQKRMIEKAQKDAGNKRAYPGAMKMSLPKVEIRKSGEKATKNGYPCVKYEVLRDGKKIRELWVTDWDNIDGGDEAKGAFKSMIDFTEDLGEMFGRERGSGFGPWSDLNIEDGFPVVTREFDEYDGSLDEESFLRRTRRRTLDPADFEPPAGYKRRSMFPRD